MDEQIILRSLSINFYRKSENHASLVFKTQKRVHRLPTIVNAMLIAGMLKGYECNLKNNTASEKFVFRIDCVNDKYRLVEIKLNNNRAILTVQEVLDDEELKLCFTWMGDKEELAEALQEFREMASRVWISNAV
jgi:hypothetical protein